MWWNRKIFGFGISNRNLSKTVRGRRNRGKACGKSASVRFPCERIFPAVRKTLPFAGRGPKERYKKLGRREGEDDSSPVDMIEAMDLEVLDIGVVFRTYTA